jgi:hypothetical protein
MTTTTLKRTLNETDWRYYENDKIGIHPNDIEMFIVPNGLVSVGEDMLPSHKEGKFSLYHALQSRRLESDMEFYGLDEISLDDWLVQVWFLDPKQENPVGGHSNLNDHGYFLADDCVLYKFPSYIPLSLIKRLKEGDKFEFEGSHGKFTVTVSQSKWRYRRYGQFEEVLDRLIERAKELYEVA